MKSLHFTILAGLTCPVERIVVRRDNGHDRISPGDAELDNLALFWSLAKVHIFQVIVHIAACAWDVRIVAENTTMLPHLDKRASPRAAANKRNILHAELKWAGGGGRGRAWWLLI